MGVVDVQIDHRSADACRIEEVGDPLRLGDDPFEMAAQQPAILAAGDQFLRGGEFAQKGQHVGDEQLPAGRFGGPDHLGWRCATSSAIGFSHSTCLPAARAAIVASACRWGGRQTSTRSIAGSASSSIELAIAANALQIHLLRRGDRNCL